MTFKKSPVRLCTRASVCDDMKLGRYFTLTVIRERLGGTRIKVNERFGLISLLYFSSPFFFKIHFEHS